jgi:type IV pilus assembly protein PilA
MKTKQTRKGFTLMELIVVIAIMGILLAILVPSWQHFLRRAHERDAGSKAKIVFNAAQTEATRLNIKERNLLNQINNPSTDSSKKDLIKTKVYMGSGDFYFYWDGKNGVKCDKDGKDLKANELSNAAFSRAVNGVVGLEKGKGTYKIYVTNYNVVSVIYSDLENGRYKGTYPVGMTDLSSTLQDKIRSHSVKSTAMSDFKLP